MCARAVVANGVGDLELLHGPIPEPAQRGERGGDACEVVLPHEADVEQDAASLLLAFEFLDERLVERRLDLLRELEGERYVAHAIRCVRAEREQSLFRTVVEEGQELLAAHDRCARVGVATELELHGGGVEAKKAALERLGCVLEHVEGCFPVAAQLEQPGQRLDGRAVVGVPFDGAARAGERLVVAILRREPAHPHDGRVTRFWALLVAVDDPPLGLVEIAEGNVNGGSQPMQKRERLRSGVAGRLVVGQPLKGSERASRFEPFGGEPVARLG